MIDTYSMYIIASLFFISGIAAGAVYGFMVDKSAMDILIFIVAGGFAGSAAGGLVFTFLYFTGQNEDEYEYEYEENINEKIDEKKLQAIADTGSNSSMKVLPEKSGSSINLSEDGHGTFPGTPKPDSIIAANKNISADARINTSAEIDKENNQSKKKLLNKLKFSIFKIPKLKFKTKGSIEKLKSNPAGEKPEKKETDKQKIKRLKKEIKKLKKLKKQKKQKKQA